MNVIHSAAIGGHADVIKLLLERKYDVDLKDLQVSEIRSDQKLFILFLSNY